MKISVRTTHYTNDNSPQLRGYATVKFDDSYVLESVKIMERQDSNEIFIALPSLMVRTKDQNGNYVINDKGEYVKEFKEVFHPITAESRKVLNSAIMDSFSKNDGKYTTVEFGNDRFQPTLARIFESSVKDIEGVGSVIFSDSFVLENVQVRNGKSGEYFDSPKRKVRNEKKRQAMSMWSSFTQRAAFSGSFILCCTLAQSRLWMDTPNPRVTKPMMSSPGSGEQHLANLMGQLSMPSTTTPSEE